MSAISLFYAMRDPKALRETARPSRTADGRHPSDTLSRRDTKPLWDKKRADRGIRAFFLAPSIKTRYTLICSKGNVVSID